jgi:hypothetical protein
MLFIYALTTRKFIRRGVKRYVVASDGRLLGTFYVIKFHFSIFGRMQSFLLWLVDLFLSLIGWFIRFYSNFRVFHLVPVKIHFSRWQDIGCETVSLHPWPVDDNSLSLSLSFYFFLSLFLFFVYLFVFLTIAHCISFYISFYIYFYFFLTLFLFLSNSLSISV